MTTERAADLLASLRSALWTWDCAIDGDNVTFQRSRPEPYRPPRRIPSWEQLLARLDIACEREGIPRGNLLPLRGLSDAELTFSAVQALDPYLKHRQMRTYSSGYLPQPVVRLTGERDHSAALRPGFLTSFVNASVVQPIATVDDHVNLIDAWLGILSAAGFHAQHVTIAGSLAVWRRREIAGITLRFRHGELTVGDAVLLWNAVDPSFIATDIGSGLERLRWALTRQPWAEVVCGRLAHHVDARTLDAIRTATLIAGSGIGPASRGPGGVVRRLLRHVDPRANILGLSRVVRWAHAYWSVIQTLPVPWPEVCRALEAEIFEDG